MIERKAPMSKMIAAALGLLLVASPALAAAPVPGFQDLESAYAGDATLGTARQSLAAAIPAGTPVADARGALADAGATCKPQHRGGTVERCLIHQYSLADGAADDIRWTILLNEAAGRVDTVSLNRSVDRHGTN
jgi:hypothetical protein